jgi:DNA-binding transcriptional LysR family regulator
LSNLSDPSGKCQLLMLDISDTDEESGEMVLPGRTTDERRRGPINVASLDLNLLVSLDALLRERSVTRAARRLGLSQPSLSAALRRLRRHFGDDLLVRTGNTYQLTPLAVFLAERTAVALAGVERVFDAQAEFDPASCTREFTVLTSDYGLAVVGPVLVSALAERAPRARIRFRQPALSMVAQSVDDLRTTDTLIFPHGFFADLPHLDLFRDRWVCIVADDNRAVGQELTVAQLGELPWVSTLNEPTAYNPAHKQLDLLGVRQDIAVVTDGFLAVAGLVAGSRRVALLQERLASSLPPDSGVRVLECPFEAVPLVEALWWHPVSERDPEHRLLRAVFADVARSLDACSLARPTRAEAWPDSGRSAGPSRHLDGADSANSVRGREGLYN